MDPISKKQLDRLGKRFKRYEERPTDRGLLQNYRDFRSEALPTLLNEQKNLLQGMPVLQSARAKRTDTIVRKLRRETTMQLSSVSDIIGFRIIVPSLTDQLCVLDKLESSLEYIAGIDNYIEQSRTTGYRAAHIRAKVPMSFGPDSTPTNFLYEIQIRTVYQHIWSTMSESFGENVKVTGGTGEVREFLSKLSQAIQEYEVADRNRSQDKTIQYSEGIQFVLGIFEFDRNPIKYRFGTDILAAVREMRVNEDRYGYGKADLVLLATSSNESDLETTHMRYFVNNGIPSIPDCLNFNKTRP